MIPQFSKPDLTKTQLTGLQFVNDAIKDLIEYREFDMKHLNNPLTYKHICGTMAALLIPLMVKIQMLGCMDKREFEHLMLVSTDGAWSLVGEKLMDMAREGKL